MGVALDVMECEPLKRESKLWTNNKVIITPHNSFISDKCKERLLKVICNNLYKVKEGVMINA